ncbi:atrial natriuretic peptide receptor 3-like [Gigantopelta aegis]|uniref:atrial natriuretic peptide receptor 3-like n=1 Tax=Gigantopelta aegis TaxID=1735272 RepID=UPI001B88ADF4|nr:atrial natriuretic peptide receptor 3-like [Gigantopelta aegis]
MAYSLIPNLRTALACVVVVCFSKVCGTSRQNVSLAVLLPDDNKRLFSLSRVTSAIELATESVIKEGMLTTVRLNPLYDDSNCSIADAMNAAIDFYVNKKVVVYIGPSCDYAAAPVARQVKYWNLPMITAGAFAGDFGDNKGYEFPMLTRIGSSFNALARFFMVVLKHFSWTKANLVYSYTGHGAIMDKFCHVLNNAIHHAFRIHHDVGNFTEVHQKFHRLSDILPSLAHHLGNELADSLYIMQA